MADYISSLNGAQMDAALLDMAEHNSEAYAVGQRNGFDVDSSDITYHNNAKYYAEEAARVIPGTGTAAVRYDVPQVLTEAEKTQARNNIGLNSIDVDTAEFISRVSSHNHLAKIIKLTGKSVVQNNAIVDTDIKGFGSTGVNIWNGEYKSGRILFDTGEESADSSSVIPKDFISVLPNTTYKLSGSAYVFCYDSNKAYISVLSGYYENTTFTTLANTFYIKLYFFGQTVLNNVGVMVGGNDYEPYSPYFRNFPIVLRSAGSVADTVEDTGNGYKVTRKIAVMDMGDIPYVYDSTNAYFYSSSITNRKYSTDNAVLSGIYTNIGDTGSAAMASAPNMSIAPNNNNVTIKFKNTSYTDATAFRNAMRGTLLYYELATPITEYHSYNLTYPVTENGTEYFDSPISVPCEIEYGVDAIKDIVSGVVGGDTERDNGSYDLLWENASPTSSFVAQDISLDLSKYKFIGIGWAINNSGGNTQESLLIIKTGKNSVLNYTVYSSGALIRIRYIYTYIDHIHFDAGTQNGSTDNGVLIPTHIYGIK